MKQRFGHKVFLVLATVFAAFVSQAGGTLADPTANADWNADATWSGGVKPVAGEEVSVVPQGDITLTMSADDSTEYSALKFRASTSTATPASLTFDGRGHKLLMPYSAAGNYAAAPFWIYDGAGNQALKLDDSKLDAADQKKASPLCFSNALFTIAQTATGVRFRMSGGTLNTYDPAGTAYAKREVLMSNGSQPFVFELFNGAKAEFPNLYAGYTATGAMLFDNAELTVRGAMEFGRKNWYYPNSYLNVAATNSTFTFGSSVGFYHAATNVFKNCTINGSSGVIANSWKSLVTFENCTITNAGTLRVSEAGDNCEPAEMVFDGGTYSFGHPQIGYAGNSNGRLTIKGGATVEWAKSGDTTQGQHIGWRGTGVVDVVNGTLRSPAATYCQLRIGQYKDSYGTGCGRLNVYDGGKVEVRLGSESWASGATEGLAVGGGGHGEVYVYGGEIAASQVNIGFAASTLTTESFIRQTGGTVSVNTQNSPNYSRVGLMTFCNAGGGTWNDRNFANHAAYYLDGGVLEAARILGGLGSACQGGSGSSKFSANGGTFRQNMAPAPYVSITGFDVAEFGPCGLVFDSNGYNVSVTQDLVNKEGEDGLFVKTGVGTLTYSGDCSVSELVISNGTWLVASGATCSSAVRVEEGGTFSLVGGSTGITVGSLAVTNGTLSLDPGDTVTVTGNAAFESLTLKFSSVPAKDATQTVIVVNGTIDAASVAALSRALCDVTLADGTHAQFRVSTSGGTTTVTVTIEDDADPIGADKTLTWSGSGAWETFGNWTPNGAPDETKKAAFTSDSAGKAVEVGSAAVAGALSFGSGGYTLSGAGSLEIAGERGAAQIETTAAVTNAISVPMTFDTVVMMPIADGAKLALDGPVAFGGFKKSGGGELRLSSGNAFNAEVTLGGGRVSIGGDSFGGQAISPVKFTSGILEIENTEGDPIELSRPICPAAGDNPVVFEVKTDAKFPLAYTSARMFKRGVGALEMEVSGNQTMNYGAINNDYAWGIVFDEKGNVDEVNTKLSGAVTVAEGKLRLAAKPGLATKPVITCNKSFYVGGQYTGAKSSPELELEGVELRLTANSSGTLRLGGGMMMTDSSNAPTPVLRLKNATIGGVYYPEFGTRTGAGITPTFYMTNSVFVGRVQTYFGGVYGTASLRFVAIDSTFEFGDTLLISSGLSADVTNTVVSANGGNCGVFQFHPSYSPDRCSQGYFRLAAGSDFRVNAVAWNNVSPYAKEFKLVFDSAIWTIGDTNLTLSSTAVKPVAPSLFSVELQAGGIRIPVNSGRVFSSDCRFFGNGGIVKTGTGSLAFGAGAYAFTGVCDVKSGTVDLSSAGTVTNAVFAGNGTISGATFGKGVKIRLSTADDWTGGATPTFDGCTFTDSVLVDFGRTLDNPLNAKPLPKDLVIAKFTNGTPDVSKLRIDKTSTGGTKVSATFTADGSGNIRMSVNGPGEFVIFVR